MIRFRRNKTMVSSQIILLLVYLIAMLYFLGLLVHLNGQRFYLGSVVLFLWAVVIIMRDICLLLHALRWVEFRGEGVCIRRLNKETVYPWREIKEAELRELGWAPWGNLHPEQVVLSLVELPDSIRKWLCTDLAPWLFKNILVEFELQGQAKEQDIRLQLKEYLPWFSGTLDESDFAGLSITTRNQFRHISYSNLLFFSFGSGVLSLLRLIESVFWLAAIIETFRCLSEPAFQIGDLPNRFWIVGLILSLLHFIWQVCVWLRVKSTLRTKHGNTASNTGDG